MDTFDEAQKRKKLTWPVIALMDFVTVIGFDDIIYNFQNQGLAVVSDWILLLILFVVLDYRRDCVILALRKILASFFSDHISMLIL